MNRKGFAITTIIYGLSVLGVMVVFILMGILSSTRSNVSSEATRVEEELINFSKSNVVFTNSEEWVVPKGESGWYRFEIFGAPATSGSGSNLKVARGAYVTGIIEANENEKYTITINNTDAAVSFGGSVIMNAAGGSIIDDSIRPGGTLLGQCGVVPGGKINDQFALDDTQLTFNGSQDTNGHGVLYGDACSNGKSYINGYPGLTHNSSKYFVDGFMIAGVSNKARVIITNLTNKDASVETIPRKNKKFDNVTNISVEYDGRTGCPDQHTIDFVSYTVNGTSHTCSGCANNSGCVCSLAEAANIDDISIVFKRPILNGTFVNRNISCYRVKLMQNGYNNTVYDSVPDYGGSIYGVPWTPTGIKLSAYQPDYSESTLPLHGNYYIISVTDETKALSAKEFAREDGEELQAEYLNGDSRQKWSIDLINYGQEKNNPNKYKPVFRNLHNRCIYNNPPLRKCLNEYRILELSRFKALSIFYDENRIKNGVSTHETFNSLSRNDPQLWNIISVGDGTFAIRTTVSSFDPANRTGFLLTNTTPGSDRLDTVYIGYGSNSTRLYYDIHNTGAFTNNSSCKDSDCDNDLNYTNVERFYLYSLDFSS